MTLKEVAESDAEVGAVGPSLVAGEGLAVRALEPESAIIGLQRGREETRGAACLHLEPGIGAFPQGQVCGAEVAGAVSLVGVGREAELHVVVKPVTALTADGVLVQVFETRRVLITHY